MPRPTSLISGLLALDFGTETTRVADASGKVVFEEPTIAAVHVDSGELVAFGTQALGLGARSSPRVHLVRPVRAGQLVDLELTEHVLADVLRRCGTSGVLRPRVVVCTHIAVTDVQTRAMEKALRRAGVRRVDFVESPLACAIASGMPIEEPVGQMVIDVGAGVTDCAIIALGGIAVARSEALGGNDFSGAVRDHLARRHRLLLDEGAVRDLCGRAGSLDHPVRNRLLRVLGRETGSGHSVREDISSSEIMEVLESVGSRVVACALDCVRTAAPELANDLLATGALLTGGGSRLSGLDRRLAQALGVPVHVASDRGGLAVLGATRVMHAPAEFSLIS